MSYILYGIVAVVVAALIVIVFRTVTFRPKDPVSVDGSQVEFDRERAVERLQKLIQFKTVSNRDPGQEDSEEFEKLIASLPSLYPNVSGQCTFLRIGPRSLLFKWEGKRHEAPVVLMAHFDVVPAEEEFWEEPPFGGVLKDNVLWGRGALDTKVTLNAALSAADALIEKGFVPENDIYFAFSGNEEIYGNGADKIVDYMQENGIVPALVLDEGGAVVQNVFPGVDTPCGLIGIAEKGLMDIEFITETNGGHASAPKPQTPVGILAKMCCRVEKHPFPAHLTEPVAEMFDTLGRHSTFLYRMIFANLWCFSWLLDIICKKRGGELNALMRTTTAFTQMQGSRASNVIPASASMTANIRLNPKDSVRTAVAHLQNTINDPSVEIKVLTAMEPSRISPVDCEAFEKVAKAVASTWKGSIVSPYLMVQCSDSRWYGRIAENVYRFSAMDLTAEERGTIHGNNERIRLETLHKSVEFYIRLILQC